MSDQQPMPIPNSERPLIEVAEELLRQRSAYGIKTYGTPLQPFNGRDFGRDADEEIADFFLHYLGLRLESARQRFETLKLTEQQQEEIKTLRVRAEQTEHERDEARRLLARSERENSLRMTDYLSLLRKLAEAQALSYGPTGVPWKQTALERLELLKTAQARIAQERPEITPLCAEHAQTWYTARNEIRTERGCLWCDMQARIRALEEVLQGIAFALPVILDAEKRLCGLDQLCDLKKAAANALAAQQQKKAPDAPSETFTQRGGDEKCQINTDDIATVATD